MDPCLATFDIFYPGLRIRSEAYGYGLSLGLGHRVIAMAWHLLWPWPCPWLRLAVALAVAMSVAAWPWGGCIAFLAFALQFMQQLQEMRHYLDRMGCFWLGPDLCSARVIMMMS